MMAKRLKLATRGFGAEPGVPDTASLAAWIADHRGEVADITTFRVSESLAPQAAAGIGMPCAGGKFYESRILRALGGVRDHAAVQEIHADLHEVTEDAAGIVLQHRGVWCSLPAPHVLKITDSYYHDPDEWNEAICEAYRTLMRGMRDTGIAGHILICDTVEPEELARLARRKVFFFSPVLDQAGCEALLEYQDRIAAGNNSLDLIFGLSEEYPLSGIVLLDPDPESVDRVLSRFDPDKVVAGGYCTDACGRYWKKLVEEAVYWK